jgi:hypothetical protein
MPNRNSINYFGHYHIDFERTTVSTIQQLANTLNMKVLEMRTFTRIPDKLYDISQNRIYIMCITSLEKLFALFGPVYWGREIFFVLGGGKGSYENHD